MFSTDYKLLGYELLSAYSSSTLTSVRALICDIDKLLSLF